MIDPELYLEELHQQEMRKEAEKERLAQEVLAERRKLHPHYNPALAWVGRRMVMIGKQLMHLAGEDEGTAETPRLN